MRYMTQRVALVVAAIGGFQAYAFISPILDRLSPDLGWLTSTGIAGMVTGLLIVWFNKKA